MKGLSLPHANHYAFDYRRVNIFFCFPFNDEVCIKATRFVIFLN